MISRSSFLSFLVSIVVVACGGSANPPPPDEPGGPGPVPPTITQQPQSPTVAAGQTASFSVAATGTAPLSYQWQRDGVAIAGATATTYAIAVTTPADSGATFRAVVTNIAGSATSNTATLTVTVAPPVLTIAPQPADASVVAGTAASFTVGGSCSSGTLAIQWQRGAGSAFADIAGATSPTYTFTTALADNGAQFRAALSCSGQAATGSSVATLTVTAPAAITLSLLPVNGLRAQAPFQNSAVAIDTLPDGSHAFLSQDQIWRLAADRLSIAPIAGSDASGFADGTADAARFSQPQGLTHDGAGVVYVADTFNHVIRRVAADATVTTIAGAAGAAGNTDGNAGAARFNRPRGIALGPDGDLYVADAQNARIRRVTPAGTVTTYAGSTAGYADGAPLAAQFQAPGDLAVAANGDVYVADDNRIRRIVRNGAVAGPVETFAGNGSIDIAAPDGVGVAAGIPRPAGLLVRGNTLSLLDDAGLVRQIDLTTRAVTTLTGARGLAFCPCSADGPPALSKVGGGGVGGLAPTTGGGLVVAAGTIRAIDAAGTVTTIATSQLSEAGGTGVMVQLPLLPEAVTVDSQGRAIAAQVGQVRRIDAAGSVTPVAGYYGTSNAAGGHLPVDGTGSAAKFETIASLAAAPADVLYVADSSSLRRIGSSGAVTTVAGSTTVPGALNAQGAAARFGTLGGVAVGPNGDVFLADTGNAAIRRVDAAGNVTTYAGVFGQSDIVDGAIAQARLRLPARLAFTPDGTLWFSDGFSGAQVLRRVSPDGSTVATAAGAAPGIAALAADPSGTLYYLVNATSTMPGGLYAYDPATSTSTLLVTAPVSQQLVLGSVGPQLPAVQSIAVLASKRILLSPDRLAADRRLLVVTLP